MRDLHNSIKPLPAINPAAAITGNAATNSAIIDRQGFEAVEFVMQSGTITDGTFTPSMIEGNDPALADGSAVAAGDMLGTVANATFAATDDNKTKKLGYKGSKRYVRLVETQAGATTGGFLAATAILGHAATQPTT